MARLVSLAARAALPLVCAGCSLLFPTNELTRDLGAVEDDADAGASDAGAGEISPDGSGTNPSDGGVLPMNGHQYVVVVGAPVTWSEARTRAEAAGGYLATLTSQAEHDFVFDLATNAAGAFNGFGLGAWLGGEQPDGSNEPAGGWRWITGEPFTYTRWASGEPENANDTTRNAENRIALYRDKAPTGWADYDGNLKLTSYVIERDVPR